MKFDINQTNINNFSYWLESSSKKVNHQNFDGLYVGLRWTFGQLDILSLIANDIETTVYLSDETYQRIMERYYANKNEQPWNIGFSFAIQWTFEELNIPIKELC